MVIPITDPSDPRLADYNNLTDAQLQARDLQGGRPVFIAEGELTVRRLLTSRFTVRSLLITPHSQARLADLFASTPAPIYIAPEPIFQGIVGFPFHRGILACAERLPDPPLDQLLGSDLLVVLENTANTDNMGAVFRNVACLAGKGAGIVLSPGCCDPLYRKALRVSIGYALEIPYTRVTDWPGALVKIAAAGFDLLAMTPDPAAASLYTLPHPRRTALVLGAEGPGLSQAALERCTHLVRIPMAPGADSLNIATAGAVALSHLAKPL